MKIDRILFFCLGIFCSVPALFGNEELKEVVARIRPAVVTIVCEDTQGNTIKTGSGFFISEKGYLITNYHVLRGACKARARTSDNQIYEIEYVLAESSEYDLVKVSTKPIVDKQKNKGNKEQAEEPTPFLECKKELPELLDQVVVIGSPMQLEQTVSRGIVSGIRDHSIEKENGPNQKKDPFGQIIPQLPDRMDAKANKNEEKHYILQIDAPISPGSSGGPVILEETGEVIGIATMYLINGQNLNFAIPSLEILNLTPSKELKSITQWSWGFQVVQDEGEPVVIRQRGQDWVVPFQRQREQELIWNERKPQKTAVLERECQRLLDKSQATRRQILYSNSIVYQTGLYEKSGYLYTENELACVQPAIGKKVESFTSFKSSGTILDLWRGYGRSWLLVYLDTIAREVLLDAQKHDNLIPSRSDAKNLRFSPNYFIDTGTYYLLDTGDTVEMVNEFKMVHNEITVPTLVDDCPETLTPEKYFWHIYCKGLEADLEAGWIEPDPNDSLCGGTGWIPCPICKGEGKIKLKGNVLYETDGKLKQTIEKMERKKNANTFPGRVLSRNNPNPAPDKIRYTKCPASCRNGKIACPQCVLIERPLYKESVRDEYLSRWAEKED